MQLVLTTTYLNTNRQIKRKGPIYVGLQVLRERSTETDRKSDRQTEREREAERDRDRQTETERDGERETERDRHRDKDFISNFTGANSDLPMFLKLL